ncbi:MAG: hypothetical protein HY558_04645 [Euryarchaeota archaeon]|nr:hypothetical protein [Euryarchaeota archaeon]
MTRKPLLMRLRPRDPALTPEALQRLFEKWLREGTEKGLQRTVERALKHNFIPDIVKTMEAHGTRWQAAHPGEFRRLMEGLGIWVWWEGRGRKR